MNWTLALLLIERGLTMKKIALIQEAPYVLDKERTIQKAV